MQFELINIHHVTICIRYALFVDIEMNLYSRIFPIDYSFWNSLWLFGKKKSRLEHFIFSNYTSMDGMVFFSTILSIYLCGNEMCLNLKKKYVFDSICCAGEERFGAITSPGIFKCIKFRTKNFWTAIFIYFLSHYLVRKKSSIHWINSQIEYCELFARFNVMFEFQMWPGKRKRGKSE